MTYHKRPILKEKRERDAFAFRGFCLCDPVLLRNRHCSASTSESSRADPPLPVRVRSFTSTDNNTPMQTHMGTERKSVRDSDETGKLLLPVW